jgi:hypothetical protein
LPFEKLSSLPSSLRLPALESHAYNKEDAILLPAEDCIAKFDSAAMRFAISCLYAGTPLIELANLIFGRSSS